MVTGDQGDREGPKSCEISLKSEDYDKTDEKGLLRRVPDKVRVQRKPNEGGY